MKKKNIWISIGVLLVAGGAVLWFSGKHATSPAQQGGPYRDAEGSGMPVSVLSASAHSGDMDVVVDVMGTVTARNTAIVKARVDGLLVRVAFREGQSVKAGDLLAEIDPRPLQVLLDQAYGQLTRDQALLANAKLDLERYKGLLAKDSIAKQQVDTQESLVHQDEGVVQLDRAQVDNAKLQLGFTRITAPISGRLGLRQLDVGNMIHAADANGLVVITQTQPIAVIFSIPSDSLAPVLARIHAGESLGVDAFDRDGKVKLATGKLLTVDNQLDVTTGTVKLKAEFANTDNSLFPNQFVNARLRVETRHDSTLIPVAAIQRGTQGAFIYIIKQNQTVSIRLVTLGPGSGEWIAIEKGLQPGEQVVIAGADKLRDGAKVAISSREDAAGKDDKNHGYSGEHKKSTDAPPGAPAGTTQGGSSRQDKQ